jgi:hypothetical protein
MAALYITVIQLKSSFVFFLLLKTFKKLYKKYLHLAVVVVVVVVKA